MRMVNGFWKCQFNCTVYVELRICFAKAKHENDMSLLCVTPNAFLCTFCYSKIHFHRLGPFKLIVTMLESIHVLFGLSPVWNRYPKGGRKKGTT